MDIAVCRNPWCKCQFQYEELEEIPVSIREQKVDEILDTENIEEVKEEPEKQYRRVPPPKYCPKCISFDRDLSGGIIWTDKWDGNIRHGDSKIKNAKNKNNYGRTR
mgnify:CR=1 FL=1